MVAVALVMAAMTKAKITAARARTVAKGAPNGMAMAVVTATTMGMAMAMTMAALREMALAMQQQQWWQKLRLPQ